MTKQKQNINLLNIEDYQIVNDNLVCIGTGEIIDSIKMIEKYCTLKKRFLPNESKVISYRQNDKFSKLFHNDDYIGSKDPYVIAVFTYFVRNLKKHYNYVEVDNLEYINNKKIIENINISERKLKSVLKWLKEKNTIKILGRGDKRMIYINPDYAYNGKGIKLETYKLFYS